MNEWLKAFGVVFLLALAVLAASTPIMLFEQHQHGGQIIDLLWFIRR